MTGMRQQPEQPHDSAWAHVQGRSVFVDDRPPLPGELCCGLVLSPVAAGQIESLDLAAVRGTPGVVAVFTAEDFRLNQWGTIFQDQPFLAAERVNHVGEPVALVAATDKWSLAQGIARAQVKVSKEKPILSLPDAIAAESFLGPLRHIRRGDAKKALASAPHQVSGRQLIAGQDHFYLESQCAIAYPGEGHSVEIHASSQHPTEAQHWVAQALGF